jgi:hypothetical protein
MSKIAELGQSMSNLPALIIQYEADLEAAVENLKISGKILDLALREQGTWPNYYSQRRAELKTLMKYLESNVAATRSRIARRYEQYSIKLSDRLLYSYIDGEDEFLKINQLYLEVEELYSKYDAVVDAFDKRGFALRDLTLARVHSIQDT